jgi:hypothetical protein
MELARFFDINQKTDSEDDSNWSQTTVLTFMG